MPDQKQELSTQLANPTTQNLPAWMAGITGRLDEALSAGEVIIKSGFAPKGYTSPQAVVVACAMGARLGLDPFTAMAGIAVVNGRPTLYGDAMLAVCQNHPAWGGMIVEWEGSDDSTTCMVTIKRKGTEPYTGQFSIREAKTAQLWNKQGPWSNHPRRMLEMRARGYALRGAFADALAGFMCREEMEDLVHAEATVVHTEPARPEPARTAGPTQHYDPAPSEDPPEEKPKPRARRAATAATAAAEAKQEPEKGQQEKPPAADPHAAKVAANALFKRLTTICEEQGGPRSYPREIMLRVSKLHGADSPKDLPDSACEALGRDIKALDEVADDLAAVEALMCDWEQSAAQQE